MNLTIIFLYLPTYLLIFKQINQITTYFIMSVHLPNVREKLVGCFSLPIVSWAR